MSIAQSLRGQPVIIGAGIAGLAAALFLAPMPVVVMNKGRFFSTSTNWAQGGIAAAIGEGDSPSFHAADTIAVGNDLVDPIIATLVANEAPEAIESLLRWGVRFDRDTQGRLAVGLEAGHSHPRIVHAGGDATGHEIMVTLTELAHRTPSITLLEEVKATTLLVEDNAVTGVAFRARSGERGVIATNTVILATGGIGQLYGHTTNPRGAGGSGLLLAARAGAVLKDMEFVQFHPTAMDLGKDPMPLATEALRGQGARLVTQGGKAIMAGAAKGDLSARDIVARAIWACMQQNERVFLDCRPVADFASRFPTVAKSCGEAGIDGATTPIPVRPAAHYHMGGVETDETGHTSVSGLWACGEVASVGLHGANRLASNSLLEGIVFAGLIARDIAGRPTPDFKQHAREGFIDPPGGESDVPYRKVLDDQVGVIRDEDGLRVATGMLASGFVARHGPSALGFIIALSALRRRESRGAHYRSDFPETALVAEHSRITLADAARHAEEILSEAPLVSAGV